MNVLLICKVDEPRTVELTGLAGELDVSHIDNSIPYETPTVQKDTLSLGERLAMTGYTVTLLQTRY
jgi:hypothetical protein